MDARQLNRVAQVRDGFKDGSWRSWRIERGFTIPEVAQPAGISAVTLWRYENGQRTPRAQHALALAKVYAKLGWEG